MTSSFLWRQKPGAPTFLAQTAASRVPQLGGGGSCVRLYFFRLLVRDKRQHSTKAPSFGINGFPMGNLACNAGPEGYAFCPMGTSAHSALGSGDDAMRFRNVIALGAICGVLLANGARAETEIDRAITIISAAPKFLHGIYDLIIEGDARSILLMEVYLPAPGISTLYVVPAGNVPDTVQFPITLCGAEFDVRSAADSLTISVPGCEGGDRIYRVDARGITVIEER